MVQITFDTKKGIVRAVMGGMLTVQDVERFSREKDKAVRAMGLGSGEFSLLIETRGDIVQTKCVVEAFQSLLLHSTLKASRIATVRSGALTTIQTRRITAVRDSAQVFQTVAEAEAWLAG